MVGEVDDRRTDRESMTKYKLLNDEQMLQEAAWLISLHLEKFDCKDNTLPCRECRNTAAKLAPLFLIGIEGIAHRTQWHDKVIARTALDKIADQKWQDIRPWKPFSTPVPRGEISTIFPSAAVICKSLFDQDQEEKNKSVTYRLVKRHKDAL